MDYKIECSTKEEFDALKTKATKAKVVLLDLWKEDCLTNPSSFPKRKKDKFLREFHEIVTTWDEERLNAEFNDIVNNQILINGADLSKHYIRETTHADLNSVIPNRENTEGTDESTKDTEE
jgi:hypothetical protein